MAFAKPVRKANFRPGNARLCLDANPVTHFIDKMVTLYGPL